MTRSARRRVLPRIESWIAARGSDSQALDEVSPADCVLFCLARHEAVMLELDARSIATRLEFHDESGGTGWHGLVARLAPRNLDEIWTLDAHEMAADEDAVDVHRENPSVNRLEA